MKRILIIGATAIGLAIGAQAQVLTLGDFESPDLSTIGAINATYTAGTVLDGWEVGGSGFGLTRENVIAGNQSGFFPSAGGTITKSVSLYPGYLDKLTFKVAPLDTSYNLGYTLQIGPLSWDGNVAGSGTAGTVTTATVNIGTTLTAPATLTITFTSNSEGIAIDDVELYGAAVVPEPHLYALAAGLGLMAFAGYRRWRNAKA